MIERLTEAELVDAHDPAAALPDDPESLSPLELQWLRYLATVDELRADLKSATTNYRWLKSEVERLSGDSHLLTALLNTELYVSAPGTVRIIRKTDHAEFEWVAADE